MRMNIAQIFFEGCEGILRIASRALARQLVPDGGAVLVCGAATAPERAPEMFARYGSLAVELGKWLATVNGGHYSLVTGGCPGIIDTLQESFVKNRLRPAVQRSIGIRVELGFEQKPNPHTDILLWPRRFGPRLELMADCVTVFDRPGIIVLFPGGFGTLGELWFFLCLAVRTKRPLKIILIDDEWWKPTLQQLEAVQKLGVMNGNNPMECMLYVSKRNMFDVTSLIERCRQV